MNSGRPKTFYFLVASTISFACGDPLVAPELVTSPRVLAARVEAGSDATQASVHAAEAASVRWLVAAGGGAPLLGWGFSACLAQSVSRGLPICEDLPFARSASVGVSTDEPRFDFVMPRTLGPASRIAVSGVFCASGPPLLSDAGVDFASLPCPNTAEVPLFATVNVTPATVDSGNENPDFSRIQIQFDGIEWPVSVAPASRTCADAALSIPGAAAAGVSHILSFTIPADMSEALPQLSSHSVTRETLTLAHFVTSGDLERAYSTVSLSTNPDVVRVKWTAPSAIPSGGTLVHFYFVLRDGRGGADYREYAVCVTS